MWWPLRGHFSILRMALTTQGSSGRSKTGCFQRHCIYEHATKGTPAGASQTMHCLFSCIAQNLALQTAQLPSTVLVCKVGSLGSTKFNQWFTTSCGRGSWLYACQPSVMMQVPGKTCWAMRGSIVAAVWSGTSTIMHKPVSHSTIPRTQWPVW